MLVSCGEQKIPPTNIKESVIDTLPESFFRFYENFHTDSIFQLQHIQFPLAGVAVHPTIQNKTVDTFWQAENWIIHKAFNDYGGTFKREYRNLNGLILEYISNNTGDFNMERRFLHNEEEDYDLIYYAEMRRVSRQ